MRAAIYTRVSSDQTAQGRSVSEQETECRDVASREGWQVVSVFCDNDVSASRHSKKKRTGYPALREFIAAGECDVVLSWEASRTQRDLNAYTDLRDLCAAHDVKWSYSGRTYDLSKADDRFQTGLDALLSERESDITQARILRSMRSNAEKGRPHGRLLFGYRREYDPASGALDRQVPDEAQAPVVREVCERFASGESLHAIGKDLNRRGITTGTGAEWSGTQLARMVSNPAYIAKRVHRGKVTGDAEWPAIVDEATHRRCVTRLADPKRKTTDDHHVKYLLSGIATCGVCGAPCRVMRPRGYDTYTCTKGFCVARKVDKVDAYVTALLLAFLSQPDALAAFQVDEGTSAALDDAADLRARLDGFYDEAAAGNLSPAALARIEAQLLPQIEAAERKASRSVVPGVVRDAAADPAAAWKTFSLDQKRELLRTYLDAVVIKPTQRGRRTLDPDSIDVQRSRPAS